MYLGDFAPGETVRFSWNTAGADGASITRGTNGTLYIFKNGGLSEFTTGITDSEDHDGDAGVHNVAIATTDAAYGPGEYEVRVRSAGVDSKTVNAALAHFSIARRPAAVAHRGTAQSGAAANVRLASTASASNDFYKNGYAHIVHGAGAGQSRIITGYNGSTKDAAVEPDWVVNPDNTSLVDVYPSAGPATVVPDPAGTRAALGMASANLDTQLSTIDDLLDTEVAAIKLKTDNLPSDPADQSLIIAATDALLSAVAAISTLATAIKAKTDQLSFTPEGNVNSNVEDVRGLGPLVGTGAPGDEVTLPGL